MLAQITPGFKNDVEPSDRKEEGGLRTQGYIKHSLSYKPLVSVITVLYNGESHLEKTILSVLGQTYTNIEYILIDGQSTDGSIDIIKNYNQQIDYWISEKDNGISDAFNKGIRSSTGEWILLLNCGDKFYQNTSIDNIIKKLEENDQLITGISKHGNSFIPKKNINKNTYEYSKCMISHQATLINSNVYKTYGLYDTKLKIRMDYDFFCRIVGKVNFKYYPIILIDYMPGGISSRSLFDFWKEGFYCIIKNKKIKTQGLDYLSRFIYNIIKMFTKRSKINNFVV